jgi:hypothetical protein
LTWGGDKRAAVELDKESSGGPVSRIAAGASTGRRRHPFFEVDDSRHRIWLTAGRDLEGIHRNLQVSGTLGWQRVSFLDAGDGFMQSGADVVFDTRLDPMLARNAVYARAAWERSSSIATPDQESSTIDQTTVDARGYIGLVGQSVLMVRALREDADGPLPPFLKPMLGGMPNLRGFRRGTAVGDTLVAGSIELRVPVTSPLSVGRFGVSAFVDVGAAYDEGARLADQPLERAVGGGVWFSVAFVRVDLAVARGIGGARGIRSTRVHFGTGVSP